MSEAVKRMTPFSANPFVYIFSVVAIVAAVVYFAYGAIDRLGLGVRSADAVVTGKQYNPPGRSYYTNIVAGRTWTQSQETSETYAVTLRVGGEDTVGLVSKQLFESLNSGDRVSVKVRRTRITRRLEAVEVTR
jgi:hypothetical protein